MYGRASVGRSASMVTMCGSDIGSSWMGMAGGEAAQA